MGDIYGDMLERDLRKLRLSRQPEGQAGEEKEDEDDFSEIMNRGKLGLGERGLVPGSSPRNRNRDCRLLEEEEEEEGPPPGRRLAPLGQDKEEEEPKKETKEEGELSRRIMQMEEDQEEMNSSLMALTSHYAKVQLRLQQVVAAPMESREGLLQDLQSFATMGIPDMRCKSRHQDEHPGQEQDAVEEQRKKQAEAIIQLRGQLEELENYAYQVRHSPIFLL